MKDDQHATTASSQSSEVTVPGQSSDRVELVKDYDYPFLPMYPAENSILFIGHSYVPRISHWAIGIWRPIENVFEAKKLASALGIDAFFPLGAYTSHRHLFIEERAQESLPNGDKILPTESSLKDMREDVLRLRPRVVNIIIGTNDLCRLQSINLFRVSFLVRQLFDFAQCLPDFVSLIIIDGIIPRDSKNMLCTEDVFRENMSIMNRMLKEKAAKDDRIVINIPRGFCYKADPHSPRKAMDAFVHEFSADGIHPAPEHIFRYFEGAIALIRGNHTKLFDWIGDWALI